MLLRLIDAPVLLELLKLFERVLLELLSHFVVQSSAAGAVRAVVVGGGELSSGL